MHLEHDGRLPWAAAFVRRCLATNQFAGCTHQDRRAVGWRNMRSLSTRNGCSAHLRDTIMKNAPVIGLIAWTWLASSGFEYTPDIDS